MKQYYVSVVGRNAPNKPHASIELARAEAERLANTYENRYCTIHVFELVGELSPVRSPSHEWKQLTC